MLTVQGLFPHLDDKYLTENQKFNDKYNYDNYVTESDKLLSKKLNEEANIIQPILPSTGWRQSDVDSLNNVTDVRIQNIMLSRMKYIEAPNAEGLTDEQLIDNAIPRNLMSSEIGDYANEAIQLKQDVLSMIKTLQDSTAISTTAQAE